MREDAERHIRTATRYSDILPPAALLLLAARSPLFPTHSLLRMHARGRDGSACRHKCCSIIGVISWVALSYNAFLITAFDTRGGFNIFRILFLYIKSLLVLIAPNLFLSSLSLSLARSERLHVHVLA